MEAGKNSGSDVSSPENDKSTGDSAGVGRSYECNFCKRGFTNAQALGGHMNIHRKDKAKAKAKHNKILNNHDEIISSNTRNNNNNIIIKPHESLRYLPHQIPSTNGYYRPSIDHQVSYQVYLPSPPTNPSLQATGNYLPIWMQENIDEGRVNANLSLGIGLSTTRVEDGDHGNVKEEEEEVDLELRLGQIHDP